MKPSNLLSPTTVLAILMFSCGQRERVGGVSAPLHARVEPPPVVTTPTLYVADSSRASSTVKFDSSAPAPVPVDSAAAPTEALTNQDPELSPQGFNDRLQLLKEQGFISVAQIIEARVKQQRRKMKLEETEGAKLAKALLRLIPGMTECRKLLPLMPKTTIEIVRSVDERAVNVVDSEKMASYLYSLYEALAMENPTPFDENCSHVVGREWHEIDYRGEGMTWENQKRIYFPKGVLHFKDVDNLRRFFSIESKAPYFQKLYRPTGNAI